MFRAVFALLAAALSTPALSQAYPAKPVRIVVPFAVGGSADVYGRFLGAKLSESTGQSFVVENRPGGGAVIGTDAVAKSPADGYTVLVMSNTHTVNETLIPKKPYDLMKDLAPITGINYSDLILVIHPSVEANNLRELLAIAKAYPGNDYVSKVSYLLSLRAEVRPDGLDVLPPAPDAVVAAVGLAALQLREARVELDVGVDQREEGIEVATT